MGFCTTNVLLNLGQKTRPDNNQLKKITWKIVDSAVLAEPWIKLKDGEKKGKYLDLSRELKKKWNMKVTIIQNVIGALGIVSKGF